MKRLLDASAWIEFLSEGAVAGRIAPMVSDPSQLLVPTTVLSEVHHWVLDRRGSREALMVVASMRQATVLAVDETLAAAAAEVAARYSIKLSRSVVYACSVMHNAELVTVDRRLAELPRVNYLETGTRKKKSKD